MIATIISVIVYTLEFVIATVALTCVGVSIYNLHRADVLQYLRRAKTQHGRHVETPPEFLERYMRASDRMQP